MLIVPLEHLEITDPALDGSQGSNREVPNCTDPFINTDLDAVRLLLDTHKATPTTYRNYCKEIERLMLWSINVKNKPISSLTYVELGEFFDFLENPEPHEIWVSNRKYLRDSPEWRPFTERKLPADKKGEEPKTIYGVSTSSTLVAFAILSSIFSQMVESGYLTRNPMRQLTKKRKEIRAKDPVDEDEKVERYLDEEMWAAFQDAIEMLPKNSDAELAHYERSKFISALMYFLAPRVSELAKGKMSDFSSRGDAWWWKVIGKGSKNRSIPVPEDMVKALIRYRTYLGLTPYPLSNDDSPLVRSIKSIKKAAPITDRQINFILDHLFESAAKLLEQKAAEMPPNDIMAIAKYQTRAAKIRQASSHWGRHTSITYMVRSGIPGDVVQKMARHNSPNTTARYTHEDEERLHKEAQKLRF